MPTAIGWTSSCTRFRRRNGKTPKCASTSSSTTCGTCRPPSSSTRIKKVAASWSKRSGRTCSTSASPPTRKRPSRSITRCSTTTLCRTRTAEWTKCCGPARACWTDCGVSARR
uniref:(northern house mosquito) hypothetical protein n=1 Tax=Culex pipiens TaxID=7175 RepID=A0A8D8HJD2_CULPI